MELRWGFEGFQGFSPLFPQSLLPAHPPCHRPLLQFSLYPYGRCRSQKITPFLRRTDRPQPSRSP